MCTQLTPFKTIWILCIIYPTWLLSRLFDPILSLCTQMTPFKTIWPNFTIVYPIDSFQDPVLLWCTLLTPFKTICHFITVYWTDSFQHHLTWFYHCVPRLTPFKDHLTQFYHCVPYWLLSIPFNLILSLSTQMTPFKTIWPDFCIVYTTDSFQHDWGQFYHCVPRWLLSRTIWPNFIIVYPIDSFQHKK